jgi:plastocyanin
MRTTVTACAALALVAAAPALAACSGDSSAATRDGAQAVTVHVTDQLRFVPAEIHVHVGTVRITLVDDGTYPHNLVAHALRAKLPTVSGNPGDQQTTMVLHFAEPGRYPFICSYHASAGMRGAIVVEP